MPEIIGWQPIRITDFLSVAACLIGLNRGVQGERAGLRTTLLVCLAASISMIQADLLLGTAGRSPDSDVVTLFSILCGCRSAFSPVSALSVPARFSAVFTKAATLCFVTVIGLCFGSGHIGLGAGGTALGLIVLPRANGSRHAGLRLGPQRRPSCSRVDISGMLGARRASGQRRRSA
jgi:putative Mg2+ transporter-C (MgtC) family protein